MSGRCKVLNTVSFKVSSEVGVHEFSAAVSFDVRDPSESGLESIMMFKK